MKYYKSSFHKAMTDETKQRQGDAKTGKYNAEQQRNGDVPRHRNRLE